MQSKKLLKLMGVLNTEKLINCLKIINHTHKEFVYVTDKKKKLIGILTDADVRRALLKKKNLNESINSIYNKKPKYAHETDSLKELDNIFKKSRVNFLPIINAKKIVVDFILLKEHQKTFLKANEKTESKAKTLIIMAGGKGLRLRPLTKNTPKPLIKITNKKSILEYNIDHFLEQGIKKIFILTHYLSHKIKSKIKKNAKYNKIVTVVKERKQMGTIGGINLLSKKNLEFPMIVMNGDIVSDINLESFINFHISNKNDLTVALKSISSQSSFGEISIQNLKIKSIEEKEIKTTFINAGLYCFSKKILNILKSNKEKINMDFLIRQAVKKKYKVGGYPMLEFWMDIGNKKNLDIIRNILKKK
jgi:dTDP-glucose pyrophosphorylase